MLFPINITEGESKRLNDYYVFQKPNRSIENTKRVSLRKLETKFVMFSFIKRARSTCDWYDPSISFWEFNWKKKKWKSVLINYTLRFSSTSFRSIDIPGTGSFIKFESSFWSRCLNINIYLWRILLEQSWMLILLSFCVSKLLQQITLWRFE
jgi:hypothetical protein